VDVTAELIFSLVSSDVPPSLVHAESPNTRAEAVTIVAVAFPMMLLMSRILRSSGTANVAFYHPVT
jgi:hypothetical protein